MGYNTSFPVLFFPPLAHTLNCEKLKNSLYPAIAGEFQEDIDFPLCKLMVEDDTHVPLTVKEAKLDAEGNTLFGADEKIIFRKTLRRERRGANCSIIFVGKQRGDGEGYK
jgi:hypothetical protein